MRTHFCNNAACLFVSQLSLGNHKKYKKEKERKSTLAAKKLLTSIKEKGPLGEKSPYTRKGGSRTYVKIRLWVGSALPLVSSLFNKLCVLAKGCHVHKRLLLCCHHCTYLLCLTNPQEDMRRTASCEFWICYVDLVRITSLILPLSSPP